ncbi:ABC-three component system protein [Enterococcus mundtii]|uniref:ABC-three component system protein n=1 Tax=Enterococcus mundtii TaxID=53346 RepID=UPI000E069AE8|nr:ABC-three component system protein [Enterococcus mundtii]STD27412.1 Uncharacterised protein [Enterococcus mundtii]
MIGGKYELTATDGSLLINGHKNQVTQLLPPIREPKRSLIYDVCKMIAEKDFEETSEYSIYQNINWTRKIEYNEIKKYKILFEEYSFAREDIEELLEGYEKRTTLIKHIKTLYINSIFELPDEDNDVKLDWVFTNLCTIVDEADNYTDKIYMEDRDQAIYQLMFYAFTKCQILEIPPIRSEQHE